MTRYLTVHFYGAMLYFVGFYVLLLFDIVLCIQVENLTAITASEQTMAAYLQNSFFSAGYLMAASIVALKCLNLVPDLAAWMIPEGDTAFSTRNFGEGVAQQAKMSATGHKKPGEQNQISGDCLRGGHRRMRGYQYVEHLDSTGHGGRRTTKNLCTGR